MNVTKTISIFLLLLYFSNEAYAQSIDSLRASNEKYRQLLISEDNSLNFLFYKNKKDVLLNNLGPFGSTSYYTTTKGLYSLNHKQSTDSLRFKFYQLKSSKPFTNLSYINASRNEQVFSITHLQHLGSLLFLDIDYQKTATLGLYNNQKVDNSEFQARVKFQDKHANYKAGFSTVINKSNHQLNGGIVNRLDFEDNLLENRQTVVVNLMESEALNKDYQFELNQKINLLKLFKTDSFVSHLALGHKVVYGFTDRIFFDNDPLATIYDTTYLSSSSTVDSIYHQNFENELYLGIDFKRLNFNVFASRETHEYFQVFNIDTLYNNTYLGVRSSFKSQQLEFDLKGKYNVEGYNKNDLSIGLNLDYSIKRNYKVNLNANFSKQTPTLFYNTYVSNHYGWENNNFIQQTATAINASVKQLKYKLEIETSSKMITDLIYMDSLASPAQLKEQVSFSTFSIKKNYKLMNFYFRTALFYQITSDAIIAPLPELIARQVIYYQNYLFKKKLKIQLGVNVYYSSEYYGYAYLPATGSFYTQNKKTIGEYPYLDVFLNTQIKRAQLFLKYEHINAGWSGYSYYATPNYPAMDGSFKFGISWNLFD